MSWVRRLLRREEVERNLDAEVRSYVDLLAAEKERAGVPADEAKRAAFIAAGGIDQVKEEVRDARAGVLIEQVVKDIRYACRALGHSPAFTLTALVTLALGIGASTAVYSVVHQVLLRPLPFAEPDRVVRVLETNPPLAISAFTASMPNFLSWKQRSRSFAGLVAVNDLSANLTGEGDPVRVQAEAVSSDFWEVLGISLVAGRAFLPGEDLAGGPKIAIVSAGLWRRRFGGDPSLIGRGIEVNGETRTVVGIAPQDIGFRRNIELWMPLGIDAAKENRANHYLMVIGRLAPGVSVAQAEAELTGIAEQLDHEYPGSNKDWRVRLRPAFDWIVNDNTQRAMKVLLLAAGVLLLIACANIAGLQLARATARVHELGLRIALGAGLGRLTRQLMTESLVLAAAGGLCGVGIAYAGVGVLRNVLPPGLPRLDTLSVDGPVLIAAAVATLATGLLFGIAPVVIARHTDPLTTIKRSGRGAAGGGRVRARQVLVAGQIALATVLITGALLLLKSFERLEAVDRGFDSHGVLTASISLPERKYPEPSAAAVFYRRLLVDLRALPGVEAAGMSSVVPFGRGGSTSMSISVDRANAESIQAQWRIATADYFHALRIPLKRGRLFAEDEPGRPFPILLGEGAARRLWPDGSDPIGRRVRVGGQPFVVAGVVGDVRQTALSEPPDPAMYMPANWSIRPTMTVVIRTGGDPAAIAPSLRHAVTGVDSQQPLFDVRTMDDVARSATAATRLNAWLLGLFAAVALALGTVGVGGVVAYAASRRRSEMALRLALGASPAGIVRMIAGEGVRICVAGLAVGSAGGYWLGKTMAALLFEVEGGDLRIHALSAAALLVAAIVACWLPARRLASIDPAATLRAD